MEKKKNVVEKVRLEYLYPNINNERRYHRLEKEPLLLFVANQEIIWDEQMQELVSEKSLIWKHNTRSELIEFDLELVQYWSNEVTEKIANYLEKNPLALPRFIQNHIVKIISGLLGEDIYYPYTGKFDGVYFNHDFDIRYFESTALHITTVSYHDKSRKNLKNYLNNQYEAKYKLAVFSSVLSNLLDRGVNLEEYKFSTIGEDGTYCSLNTSTSLKEIMDQAIGDMEYHYVREDGEEFSKEEILEYFDIRTLSDFFSRIMELSERDYYSSIVGSEGILNPEKLLPVMNKNFKVMGEYPKENLISVEELCQRMRQKLKKCKQETEIVVIERKIEQIKRLVGKLKEEETSISLDTLGEKLNELYQEIDSTVIANKRDFLQLLEAITKEAKASEEYGETPEDLSQELEESEVEESDRYDTLIQEDLIRRMGLVENQLIDLTEKMDSLEFLLENYLKNGGLNPLKTMSSEDIGEQKECIEEVLNRFETTTFGQKVRKRSILGNLRLGALGAVTLLGLTTMTTKGVKPLNLFQSTTLVDEALAKKNKIGKSLSKKENAREGKKPETDSEEKKTEIDMEEELREIIIQVINGEWGYGWNHGDERRERLEEAGYDSEYILYIRAWVNKIIGENISANDFEKMTEEGMPEINIEQYVKRKKTKKEMQ